MPSKPTDKNKIISGFLDRCSHFLKRRPRNRAQLLTYLHQLVEDHLINADAMSMIDGVIQVSETKVRDIMVPRAQMVVIPKLFK